MNDFQKVWTLSPNLDLSTELSKFQNVLTTFLLPYLKFKNPKRYNIIRFCYSKPDSLISDFEHPTLNIWTNWKAQYTDSISNTIIFSTDNKKIHLLSNPFIFFFIYSSVFLSFEDTNTYRLNFSDHQESRIFNGTRRRTRSHPLAQVWWIKGNSSLFSFSFSSRTKVFSNKLTLNANILP